MRPTAALALALVVAGCASSPPAVDDGELLRLNEAVFRTMIVDRDTALFARLAPAEFRVLAPGGMVEDRAQAIAGVTGWDADGIEVTGAEVVRRGDVAVVTGRLDIDGTMRPVGRWGPLKFLSVFVREGDGWRLLSRSLTPCLDPLIAAGRC